MYAGKTDTVPLPTEGHLHIQKNGYVYWEENCKWDSVNKRPVSKRVSIGKLDPEDKTRLFPNRKYHELFDPLPLPGDFARTLSFGPYAAIRAAGEKTGCLPALQETFPFDADEILALAVHAACAERGTAQNFDSWCFDNYCGLKKSLRAEEIDELYRGIGCNTSRMQDFLAEFRRTYLEHAGKSSDLCVAFAVPEQRADSDAETVFCGEADQNDVPQLDTAVFTDGRTGTPLGYEFFFGSIAGEDDTPFTLERARALGFSKMLLVLDSDSFMENPAIFRGDEDTSLVAFCSPEMQDVRALIAAWGDAVRDRPECHFEAEQIHGMRIPKTQILGGVYDAYLFYDPRAAAGMHNYIDELVRLAGRISGVDPNGQASGTLASLWAPETKRQLAEVDSDAAVEEELATAGFFCIASNADLDTASILRTVRMAQSGGSELCRLMRHFDSTSARARQVGEWEGKTFVAFVAFLLIESFRWLVHGASQGVPDDEGPITLDELRMYEISQSSPGVWAADYAMTQTQKDVFGKLGLSEDQLRKFARDVSIVA